MKRVIPFSRAFLPCVILSVAIIASGIFGYFTKGINYGIDFQAGFIEKVRIAPTALSLTYEGSQSVTVEQSSSGIDLVVTGVGSDNQTYNFPYSSFSTVGSFASAVTSIPGVRVSVAAPADTPLGSVFPDSSVLARLSQVEYRLHYVPSGAAPVSADEVRSALSGYPAAAVQGVGKSEDRMFQIRVPDDGTDENASATIKSAVSTALLGAFGAGNVAVYTSDFVGSRFSSTLASQSALLVIMTLGLIWVYATIRFRWDFAIGAVLAILHDALVMIAFIVWTRMQFNSVTIAALLTILGYSINDTVVIFDRIRENMRLHPELGITDILNLSQSEMLGRSVITTLTTMLAVVSLYVFTTGDMKDFALALLVGMTSGVYSTIMIASAFISFIGRYRKDGGRIAEKAPRVRVAEEIV